MPRFKYWLLALVILLPLRLDAQQNASVQGTVVDESKGAMPGVTVTATEISTGRQSLAVTAEDGRYRLENLPPGRLQGPHRAFRASRRRRFRTSSCSSAGTPRCRR